MRADRRLTWSLIDSEGAVVADVDDRDKGEVEVQLNAGSRSSVEIALSARAAGRARAFGTRLLVRLSGFPIFNGAIVNPVWSADDRTASLAAICPSEMLARSFLRGMPRQSSVDQAEIMWQIVYAATGIGSSLGGPGAGIVEGPNAASYLRDRFYPDGTNAWEAMIALSEVTNGVDFDLAPLEGTGGEHARLDTYWPYRGHDRTASVVLTHNRQEDNASGFTWEPGGGELVNYSVAAGQAVEGERAPAWVAYDPESIAEHGFWQDYRSFPDVRYTAQLREIAEQQVATRALPVDFFDVTPAVESGGSALGFYRDAHGLWRQDGKAYGVPPRFGPIESGGEYWIGDEIRAIARVDELDKDLIGRVTYGKLSETESKHVAAEITCAPRVSATDAEGFAATVSVEDFG